MLLLDHPTHGLIEAADHLITPVYDNYLGFAPKYVRNLQA
jgi:hypothetical protein